MKRQTFLDKSRVCFWNLYFTQGVRSGVVHTPGTVFTRAGHVAYVADCLTVSLCGTNISSADRDVPVAQMLGRAPVPGKAVDRFIEIPKDTERHI